MKLLLCGASSLLVSVTMIPVVLSSGSEATPLACGVPSGPIAVVLETIRTLESGRDYNAESPTSTASGAYQFVDGTWANYGGYAHASSAPPNVQDAKAAEHVTAILAAHGSDVAEVPVVWYIGHLPTGDSPTWNAVPAGGNVLTPREYQRRWLDTYDRILARNDGAESTPDATIPAGPSPGTCFGGSIKPVVEGWSLPGPADLLVSNQSVITQPHHDYAAWDWIIPTNTPIYAIHDGTVIRVHQWQNNWWDHGCGIDPTGCVPCGVGLTILDGDGTRWTYCHGTNLTISPGDAVVAGQQVMWSGNTGRSGTAHLHLEITTRDDVRRCPQPLVAALVDGGFIEPRNLAVSGCWLR